jgi:hypothetical protein
MGNKQTDLSGWHDLIARERRTRALLAEFNGAKNEFGILHGILCMGHGQEDDDRRWLDQAFDLEPVAKRMDAINTEIRLEYLRSLDKS